MEKRATVYYTKLSSEVYYTRLLSENVLFSIMINVVIPLILM